MTKTAIAANVHQTLDVHLDALSEIALDVAFGIEDRTDLVQFVFTQILDLGINVDTGLFQGSQSHATCPHRRCRSFQFVPSYWAVDQLLLHEP